MSAWVVMTNDRPHAVVLEAALIPEALAAAKAEMLRMYGDIPMMYVREVEVPVFAVEVAA